MVIRPLVAASIMGETGRPAASRGTRHGGSADFYGVKDSVSLGAPRPGAGLYAASAFFKMTGTVELTSDD